MKRKIGKFLSVLLASLMLVGAVPTLKLTSLAVEKEYTVEPTGQCGEDIYWTFDSESGALTIYGTGNMNNYVNGSPFYSVGSIKSLTVADGVTGIGNYAFYGCKNLASAVIPDSVTSVGNAAFMGCEILSEIALPDGLTYVGFSAFENCKSLTSIVIPENVTRTGSCAFKCCTELTSAVIGGGDVADDVFNGCTKLTSVELSDKVTSIGRLLVAHTAYYFDDNNWEDGVLYIGNHLVVADKNKVPSTYSVKPGTRTIALEAFAHSSTLTNITIPDSVKIICNNAFNCCEKLTNVYILGDGLTCIGEYGFYHCVALKNITIPDSVTEIGTRAFSYCTSIKTINIPNGITSIADDAFSVCGLTSVKIPDNITNIGSHAFENCGGLTELTIPDSVTNIGVGAFENCRKLENVTLPNSIKSINKNTFFGCYALKNITIPDGVTEIGSCAFMNCLALESIIIPDSVKVICAFIGCKKLNNVTLPNNLEVISNSCFKDCISLEKITIPASVTYIGYDAFRGCTGLKEINVAADNINYLSEDGVLFDKDKTNLIQYPLGNDRKSYTVPDGVTDIDYFAFEYCNNIESVILPESTVKMNTDSFGYCENLTSVTFKSANVSFEDSSFFKHNKNLVFVVLPGSTAMKYAYEKNIRLEYLSVDGLSIEVPETVEVVEGREITVPIALLPEKTAIGTLVITSSDEEIATADSYKIFSTTVSRHTFIVRGVRPGQAELTINLYGTSLERKVIVNVVSVETEKIRAVREVKIDNLDLDYRSTTKLNPTIIADQGTKYTVKYESSNTDIATVDENGNVYAVNNGEATITCTVTDSNGNTVTDICTVKVRYSALQWLLIILLFGWIWYI